MCLSFVSVLVLITVASLTVVHMVRGDYQLEILLDHYRNPSHTLLDGSCCDRPYYNSNCGRLHPCYNRFLFCIRPYGVSTFDLTSPCPTPLQNYTTGTIKSDDKSFIGTNYVYQEGNHSIPNPLVFTGKTWPGLFQLLVIVDNWAIFQTKLRVVDIFTRDWKLNINNTYSEPEVRLLGYYGFATLNVSARVMCKDSFYGPNCSYSCNPGSCNFEDPCSALSPCLNGGSCLNTNTSTGSYYYKCVCGKRYSGQNCTETTAAPSKTTAVTGSNNFLVGGPTPVNNDGNTPQDDRRRLLIGALIGGLLTIVLLLLAIFFVAICIWCKRRDSDSEEVTHLTKESKQKYGGPLDNPSYMAHNEFEQYRKLDNPLYDTHRGPQDDSKTSSTATYENISNYSTQSGLADQDPRTGTRKLLPSQYSVITRRDSDISSSHMYSDIDEEPEKPMPLESQYSLVTRVPDGTTSDPATGNTQLPVESQYSVVTHDNDQLPVESGYSVITQSNIGYDIDEASDSETEGEADESRKSLL